MREQDPRSQQRRAQDEAESDAAGHAEQVAQQEKCDRYGEKRRRSAPLHEELRVSGQKESSGRARESGSRRYGERAKQGIKREGRGGDRDAQDPDRRPVSRDRSKE